MQQVSVDKGKTTGHLTKLQCKTDQWVKLEGGGWPESKKPRQMAGLYHSREQGTPGTKLFALNHCHQFFGDTRGRVAAVVEQVLHRDHAG